jgi:hypothetical protein
MVQSSFVVAVPVPVGSVPLPPPPRQGYCFPARRVGLAGRAGCRSRSTGNPLAFRARPRIRWQGQADSLAPGWPGAIFVPSSLPSPSWSYPVRRPGAEKVYLPLAGLPAGGEHPSRPKKQTGARRAPLSRSTVCGSLRTQSSLLSSSSFLASSKSPPVAMPAAAMVSSRRWGSLLMKSQKLPIWPFSK